MDPKKLEAFGSSKGGPPPGKKEGGGKPPGGGKPKDGGKDGGDDGDGKKGGGDIGQKYGALLSALGEFSDDIEASIDELDHEDLGDPEKPMSEEDAQILKEGLGSLDKKLLSALHEAGEKGLSVEEAHEVASKAESDGHAEDADLLAGWLYRAAEAAKDMPQDDDSSGNLPDDSSGKLPDDSSGQLPDNVED